MLRKGAILAAALTLLGAWTPSALADARLYNQLGRGSMPTPPSIEDPAFQAEALRAHNVERRLVGVKDLVWYAPLAKDAQAWADYIAQKNVMEHANQKTYGESIWYNRAGMRTVGAMIAGWSIEKTMYIVGAKHPRISTTGNWHHVGHYTQMVWSGTTHVGCAVSRAKGRDWLVCRYAPLGNFWGQAAYDVTKVPKRVAEETPPPRVGPAGAAAPPPEAVETSRESATTSQ